MQLDQSFSLLGVCPQTNQLVNFVAIRSGEPKSEIWLRIYARLFALYNVDIFSFSKRKSDSLSSVAERYDFIDKVYTIVYAEHPYLQTDGE